MAAPTRPVSLVERVAALATLTAAVDGARSARGSLVFVGGEAGVGKTAVCRALAASAGPHLRIRRGDCDGVSTPAPLGPLADAAPELFELVDSPADASGVDRVRLFRRVRALLTAEPTLLLLEDLHWADEATLDLLRYLGRRLDGVPLAVVATYRSEEAVGAHPLAALRGDLATAEAVRHVALAPLTLAGVTALVEQSGSRLEPADVHRNTGGNSFFVTELLAVGDRSLPGTVRDAVLARAARLSSGAADVLSALAVLGQRSPLELVLAVSGAAGDVLDECVDRGMLVVDGGLVSFRHELARLAILETLAPMRRRDLHASALANGRAAGRLDDGRLAHHAAECADAAAVLEFAPRAAGRAARLGAHREAAQLYRLALAHCATDDAGATRPSTADLQEALAYECYLVNEPGEAHAARCSALAARERQGDALAVGVNRRWLSRLSWFLGRGDEAMEHALAAVAVLEPLGPGPELAMAYSNLAQLHMLAHDVPRTVEWGERALRLARTVGAREAEIHALNNIGTALWEDAGRPEGRTQLTRSLEMALATDAHEHVARAYTNLGAGAVALRRYADADAQLRAGIAYCQDRDLDSWSLYMTGWLAVSAVEQGDGARAERHVREILRRPRVLAIARIPAQLAAAHLAIRRGEDAGELLGAVSELARTTGELQRLGPAALARATAAWVAGDAAAIVAAVEDVWSLAVARSWPWLLGELAWWSALGGHPRDVPCEVPEPFRLMLAGRYAEAAEAWAGVGARPWVAVALGLDADPECALRGLDLADDLDAPAFRAALVRERHARGLAVPRGPRGTTRANAFRLTSREVEVLALVADGLTNAEVAGRLFVSEKTVAHHVSAALRKTGEPSRARAAAAARRAGLLDET